MLVRFVSYTVKMKNVQSQTSNFFTLNQFLDNQDVKKTLTNVIFPDSFDVYH